MAGLKADISETENACLLSLVALQLSGCMLCFPVTQQPKSDKEECACYTQRTQVADTRTPRQTVLQSEIAELYRWGLHRLTTSALWRVRLYPSCIKSWHKEQNHIFFYRQITKIQDRTHQINQEHRKTRNQPI